MSNTTKNVIPYKMILYFWLWTGHSNSSAGYFLNWDFDRDYEITKDEVSSYSLRSRKLVDELRLIGLTEVYLIADEEGVGGVIQEAVNSM